MASPFRHFRKYTGLMMALLGALLMFAFVVAEPLMQYMGSAAGGPSGGSNEVVVTWDGGQFTDDELKGLVQRRQILSAFLQQVEQMGVVTAFQQGNVDPRPIVTRLRLPSTMEEGVERDVVNTRIFADAAREAGIVVSDATIRQYLTDLGLGKVSKSQMRTLLKGMSGGQRGVSIDFIFDLLRDAMLARNFDQSFLFTSATIMPQQRWRDWRRVNDRIIVEAAEVPVRNYLSEVEDPTDAELEAFFDEFKANQPLADRVNGVELPSATPAFAQPQRVVLQYAKADLLSQVDALLDDVTEEEIAAYYEENKNQFIRSDALLGDDEPMEDEDADSEGTDEAEGDGASDDGASDDEAPEEGAAADAAPDSSTSEPAEPDAGSSDAGSSDAGSSDTDSSDTDSSDAEAAQPDESDAGSFNRRSPFRFVALQEPEGDAAAAEDASADAPAGDGQGGDTPAEEPASDKDDSPTDRLFDDIDPDAADEPMQDSTDDESASDAGEEQEEVEYQPLDEVRDEIRRLIARQKAIGQQVSRMGELVSPLKVAYTKYSLARVDAEAELGEDQSKVKPPEVLKDLEGFSKERDLEFAETATLSFMELRDSSIGKSATPSRTNPRTGSPLPLYFVAFSADDRIGARLWEPVLAYDRDSNGYIVIKTSDTPYTVPKLEEVRAEVVRAWKMQKAAELAMEQAKEIAEKAEPQGLSLKDYLAGEPGVKVVLTDPFSWFTTGQFSPTSRQIPVRMSTPEPIVAAGNEFMKAAFELEAGKLGTAFNHDKSIAYVIRVVQHIDSEAELRSDFVSEGQLMHRLYGFERPYQQQIGAALVSDLRTNLDWKREPDQLTQDDQ